MNWAVSLILEGDIRIEKRVKAVLRFIFDQFKDSKCFISDIDATGKLGNQLTKKLNANKEGIILNEKELLELMDEDGQIFELDLLLSNTNKYRIIIRDGDILDILGEGEILPSIVIGKYQELDVDLF